MVCSQNASDLWGDNFINSVGRPMRSIQDERMIELSGRVGATNLQDAFD